MFFQEIDIPGKQDAGDWRKGPVELSCPRQQRKFPGLRWATFPEHADMPRGRRGVWNPRLRERKKNFCHLARRRGHASTLGGESREGAYRIQSRAAQRFLFSLPLPLLRRGA